MAAAARNPNRRLPCSLVNTSTMNCQNTDTTNRLKTDVHTKKTRPTQMFASPVVLRNRMRNAARFSMKNR